MSVEQGFYYTGGRPEMLPFLPDRVTRVLDVGCGAGAFGTTVKQRHPDAEIWGIEPCADAAARAAGVLDCVMTGTVEEHVASLPPGSFDVVSFNDVLEHLVDPIAVLRLVRPILAPNGVIVASLPNLRFYRALKHIVWDGDFCYADHGIFDRTHLRFFTLKSVPRMFAAAGYDLLRIQGINEESPKTIPAKLFRGIIKAFPSMRDTAYLQFGCVARVKRD